MSGRTKGLCDCGNVQQSKGRYRGRQVFDRYCSTCARKFRSNVLEIKPMVCEICKFMASHQAQIDRDHIDGDHKNNDSSNIQYICANCHRLKTIENKDWSKQDGINNVKRTANKWIGRNAREYLRSIGFQVSDKGKYSIEMLKALEKGGVTAGKNLYYSKTKVQESESKQKKTKNEKAKGRPTKK